MHARWLLLALLCGAALPVAAADLTVRFTGRFLAGTCQLSVQDVDLGTFQATYFATSTQSPAVAFVLERKNCSDDLRTLHVRFVGTADSSNASYFAIPATGGVRGLAIRLQSATGTLYAPNQPAFDWPTSGGSAGQLDLGALLVRTGNVTAGAIRTPITVQVTYN
ncbi:fimbrial protein [Stenotrophomonas pavanii]|uniref:fimbrial protein n=1 Tax=Stenotrophomonas pavanii TaxID=487698 RepID=UPI0018D42148|nr:type 1 fimbrial protein [Stenotrophomonas maltophilia]